MSLLSNLSISRILWRVVVPALALVSASSCLSTKSGATAASENGPSGLSYSSNPAVYIINVPITENTIGGSVAGNAYSISPALPAGLRFDTSDGSITGTPTAITATATYEVKATNSSGVLYISLQLAVGDTPPTMSYTGSLTQTLNVGSPVSISPTMGGGALTGCTASPSLPSGLTLSVTDCAITGTPLAASATTGYTITATNTGGSSSLIFDLTVDDLTPVFSYGGATLIDYRDVAMTALSPTSSTGGSIISCSVSPTLPTGLSVSSGCVISGNASALASSTTYTATAYSYGNSTPGLRALRSP